MIPTARESAETFLAVGFCQKQSVSIHLSLYPHKRHAMGLRFRLLDI